MNINDEIQGHLRTFFECLNRAEFSQSEAAANAGQWFEEMIRALLKVRKENNGIFFIGNGASCSMASHFASDYTKNGNISSYSLNEGSLLTCFSNDYSYEMAYMEMLKRYFRKGDMLMAISSSGRSKNIINAARYVIDHFPDSMVVTFSGFNCDNPLRKMGNCNLYVGIDNYGIVESVHSYYLHMIIDLFIKFWDHS